MIHTMFTDPTEIYRGTSRPQTKMRFVNLVSSGAMEGEEERSRACGSSTWFREPDGGHEPDTKRGDQWLFMQ